MLFDALRLLTTGQKKQGKKGRKSNNCKMIYKVTNYNVTRQPRHLMTLEHADIIFVLPFSIKAPKYALIAG